MPKFETTEWLSFDESTYMEKLLGQLIVITLPEFQVGGRLRSLLRICVTVVVMHFNEYKRKYGEESSLVRKITSTATRTQLPQGFITQLSAKLSNIFYQKNVAEQRELSTDKKKLLAITEKMEVMSSQLDTLISASKSAVSPLSTADVDVPMNGETPIKTNHSPAQHNIRRTPHRDAKYPQKVLQGEIERCE